VTANNIARWDGSSWSALVGPSGTGADGSVDSLAVYDDGTGEALYVGGWFTTAGGVTANNIARWDGSAWSALVGPSGTGTDDDVESLAVYDDGTGEALYVGGYFTTAGGVTVNSIARWDGSDWSALSGPSGIGVGLDGRPPGNEAFVEGLAIHDDGTGEALYAGGGFAVAGGVTANNIARWDGSGWSALAGPAGNGVDGEQIAALSVYDDGTGEALYAGGYFTIAGGVAANNIARWHGSAWSAVGSPSGAGLPDYVTSLATHDDGTGEALYAGGDFTSAGEVAALRIARWNGSSWSALVGPSGEWVGRRRQRPCRVR